MLFWLPSCTSAVGGVHFFFTRFLIYKIKTFFCIAGTSPPSRKWAEDTRISSHGSFIPFIRNPGLRTLVGSTHVGTGHSTLLTGMTSTLNSSQPRPETDVWQMVKAGVFNQERQWASSFTVPVLECSMGATALTLSRPGIGTCSLNPLYLRIWNKNLSEHVGTM